MLFRFYINSLLKHTRSSAIADIPRDACERSTTCVPFIDISYSLITML